MVSSVSSSYSRPCSAFDDEKDSPYLVVKKYYHGAAGEGRINQHTEWPFALTLPYSLSDLGLHDGPIETWSQSI